MRILYYSKPSFGDCDFPLIKALMELGHEVIVLYHLAPYSLRTTVFDIEKQKSESAIIKAVEYEELKKYESYVNMENFYISNEPKGKICISSILLAIKDMFFIRKVKPDVIHYVEDPLLVHSLLLLLFRKRLCFTIHDGRPHTEQQNQLSTFVRRIICKYARKFILLSKNEVEAFSDGYHINPSHLFISHLGYYEMLRLCGNPKTQKRNYVLFFGRVSPYKGIEYLLRAMDLLHEKYPDLNAIIAGNGNYYFDIKRYKSVEYVEFKNRYIGNDELADLIRGAMCVVCPYIEATQSGVVASSFALNTPVIATEVGGIPEMIEDGKTGLIIPAKNPLALVRAIESFLLNKDYRKQMESNIERCSKNGLGSWKSVAEEYINIYNAKV